MRMLARGTALQNTATKAPKKRDPAGRRMGSGHTQAQVLTQYKRKVNLLHGAFQRRSRRFAVALRRMPVTPAIARSVRPSQS